MRGRVRGRARARARARVALANYASVPGQLAEYHVEVGVAPVRVVD